MAARTRKRGFIYLAVAITPCGHDVFVIAIDHEHPRTSAIQFHNVTEAQRRLSNVMKIFATGYEGDILGG